MNFWNINSLCVTYEGKISRHNLQFHELQQKCFYSIGPSLHFCKFGQWSSLSLSLCLSLSLSFSIKNGHSLTQQYYSSTLALTHSVSVTRCHSFAFSVVIPLWKISSIELVMFFDDDDDANFTFILFVFLLFTVDVNQRRR